VTPNAAAELPIVQAEVIAMATTSAQNGTAAYPDVSVVSTLQRFQAQIQRDEQEHLDRLKELIGVQAEAAAKPRRRGQAWQRRQRRLEKDIRRQAVACYRDLSPGGYTLAEVAELLGVTPRTLRQWAYDGCPQKKTALPLGRPAARSDVAARQEVLQFLKEEGPGVGVPTVQERFPDLARAELTDLVQRSRRVWSARQRVCRRRLRWPVPGRVWSLDFAEPSLRGATWSLPPIDSPTGSCPYLLAVRDLSSGYQLCWLPVTTASAAITRKVLTLLFALYGAPLVLKADNGPPFRAEQTKRFLKDAGVHFLFSPPYWPRYNGAIEASIGSLKTWTEQHAEGQGRAGHWTWADVAAARQQANAGQPRRLHGQTPAQAWAGRTAISNVQRVCFALTVNRQRSVARSELGLEQEMQLDHWQDSAVDRKAIERALVEHDYLLFRGRRIPLIVKGGKVTKIG
jgi:transposase InsO family protein